MTQTDNTSDFIEGICEHCGHDGLVWSDNARCEDCDGDFHHCSICDEEIHIDYHCRHVFKDADLEWAGSGAYEPSNTIKDSFLRLLNVMPKGFASPLRKAISSGCFHTWMVAPIIGPGGSLTLHGMLPDDSRKFGDALIELGESEDAERVSDGYHYLVSLYDANTATANSTVIAWIDEWLEAS